MRSLANLTSYEVSGVKLNEIMFGEENKDGRKRLLLPPVKKAHWTLYETHTCIYLEQKCCKSGNKG